MVRGVLDARFRGHDAACLPLLFLRNFLLRRFLLPLNLLRNDWQHQVARPAAAEMRGGGAAKDPGGGAGGMVRQEGPAAGGLVLKFRQPPAARAAIFIVLAADRERDSMA